MSVLYNTTYYVLTKCDDMCPADWEGVATPCNRLLSADFCSLSTLRWNSQAGSIVPTNSHASMADTPTAISFNSFPVFLKWAIPSGGTRLSRIVTAGNPWAMSRWRFGFATLDIFVEGLFITNLRVLQCYRHTGEFTTCLSNQCVWGRVKWGKTWEESGMTWKPWLIR